MLESAIEAWFEKTIRSMGGVTYKFTSPGNAGVPDRIVIYKGRTYLVELKQVNGVLSKIQRAQIARINKSGMDVHVVYGKQGARLFIDHLGNPKAQDIACMYQWKGLE